MVKLLLFLFILWLALEYPLLCIFILICYILGDDKESQKITFRQMERDMFISKFIRDYDKISEAIKNYNKKNYAMILLTA